MTEKEENIVETFFKTFSGKDSCSKDIEEFGKRVSSYIEGQKWVTRPLVLSPTVCSQYGWKCLNSNLLECVSCGAKLCTPDPKIEFYVAYKECINKMLKDLKTSHKTHCPWPLAPSSDTYVKMVPMPKEESLKHFMHRLRSSLTFSSNFPQIKDTITSLLGLDELHILSLCKLAEIPDKNALCFGTSAVCLAATGWTFKSQSGVGSKVYLACENCQRSIWTGSFNLIDTPMKGNDNVTTEDASIMQNGKRQILTVEESPTSKRKRLKKEDFDPLGEHRPWCLWVIDHNDNLNYQSPIADNEIEASTCKLGWKIFIKSLLRNVCEPQHRDSENNPSKEQIRSIRNLLDTWTDCVL